MPRLLAPYFEGFARFYGDAAGVARSYWALACWLYAAPFAPLLRSAALRHDGSPLAFPVQAVLYGRSDGGKTMFSRVISRSMFGIEQMIRGQHFTTARALGLREQLGAIPLLIDDVNRDRFAQYVPDLVEVRPRERGGLRADPDQHQSRRHRRDAGPQEAHDRLPHRRRAGRAACPRRRRGRRCPGSARLSIEPTSTVWHHASRL